MLINFNTQEYFLLFENLFLLSYNNISDISANALLPINLIFNNFLFLRTPSDCIEEMFKMAKTLSTELSSKFDSISSPAELFKMSEVFDPETIMKHLTKYQLQQGIICCSKQDRILWETHGSKEFEQFWSVICEFPQVQDLLKSNSELSLLPHDNPVVFRRFKNVLFDMIWKNKYGIIQDLFSSTDDGEPLDDLKSFNILSIKENDSRRFHLDASYKLILSNGKELTVTIDESKLYSLFYTNKNVR